MQRTIRHTAVQACGWLLASLVASFAMAEDEPASSAIETKIRNLAPGVSSIAISETPIDGILQVQVDNEIYYASDDARYLVIGRIMDLDTRVNLTDQAKSALRKDALANLDVEQQISFSPAEPKHELLVFTDIDCGYCRKLHNQIEEYMAEGIAIHYLAFPRAGAGSHSFEKFVSVWCSDDQQGALTLAKAGEEPEPLQCDNPINDQYQLGLSIGITGTPAMVTGDGTLIPGYMPPAQLKQRLEAIESQVAKAD